MRIVNAFRFVCRSQRPKVSLGPSHIFQPLVMDSTAQLMEIDFNLHKTNSSYFADMDIVRERRDAVLGHVLSNSFGFGGTNATLLFKHVDA